MFGFPSFRSIFSGATRGAQYRDDQRAGVDNSPQPTRGEPRCGGQAGCVQSGDNPAPGNRRFLKPRGATLAAMMSRVR